MTPDPANAPPRPDLTFLRHRAKPATRTSVPVPNSVPAQNSAAASSALADYLSGRGPRRERAGGNSPSAPPAEDRPMSFDRPNRTPAAAPTSSGALDLSRPSEPATPSTSGSLDLTRPREPAAAAPSGALDLSGPATSPPSTMPSDGRISFERPGRTAAAPPANPLDLTRDAAADTQRPVSQRGSSLDLSSPPAAAPRPASAPKQQIRRLSGERVPAGRQHLLSVRDPTVVLTRVQSGVGELTIEAATSPEGGDLRIGAAYQLRSGPTSVVQLAGGNRFAPSSRRPVIVAGRDEFEQLGVDLRQVRDLERMAVYGFSESRSQLTWGGTLVVTTTGGARIELPLESLYAGTIAVLMSIYNVAGELIVRAEMETIVGDVREATRAYGYDRITWRDGRTPVD